MSMTETYPDQPPIWKSHYNHPTQWDQFYPPLSMPGMFFRSAGRRGDANLLDFMGRKYSYGEVAAGWSVSPRGFRIWELGKATG